MNADKGRKGVKPNSSAVSNDSGRTHFIEENAEAVPTERVTRTKASVLTDTQCKNAKPSEKPYKLPDASTKGLYLLISPNGSKLWRFRFKIDGKESTAALGAYPAVSLKEARLEAETARTNAKNKTSPVAMRKIQEAERKAKDDNTFRAVAMRFMDGMRPHVAPETIEDMHTRFSGYLFPRIGDIQIAAITPAMLLVHFQEIALQSPHMAKRQRSDASRVFKQAVIFGLCPHDAAAAVVGQLPAPKTKHRARLRADEVPGFFKRMDNSGMTANIKHALQLVALTAVRSNEAAAAKWDEIDFQRKEWTIPAERTKKRRLHIVPLSTQVVSLLEAQHYLSGHGDYIFPNIRNPHKPTWTETLIAAIRRLGYSGDELTTHGFRGTFSTWANEHGFRSDAIEMQLAHVDEDKTRSSYNAAEYMPERRQILQAWADAIDTMNDEAKSSNVIPMRRAA